MVMITQAVTVGGGLVLVVVLLVVFFFLSFFNLCLVFFPIGIFRWYPSLQSHVLWLEESHPSTPLTVNHTPHLTF